MSKASQGGNLLLSRLPLTKRDRLVKRMSIVVLASKQILHQHRQPMDHVYFPMRGIASAVTIMNDGAMIEIGTVGNEGMVGHSLLSGDDANSKVIVLVAGEALRIDVLSLKQEVQKDQRLMELLLQYGAAQFAQVSQAVACNGLHDIQQRCCRWLLVALDRMKSDVIPLTHELLSILLGVRRASVTDVLGELHERGVLENSRGVGSPGTELEFAL